MDGLKFAATVCFYGILLIFTIDITQWVIANRKALKQDTRRHIADITLTLNLLLHVLVGLVWCIMLAAAWAAEKYPIPENDVVVSYLIASGILIFVVFSMLLCIITPSCPQCVVRLFLTEPERVLYEDDIQEGKARAAKRMAWIRAKLGKGR